MKIRTRKYENTENFVKHLKYKNKEKMSLEFVVRFMRFIVKLYRFFPLNIT